MKNIKLFTSILFSVILFNTGYSQKTKLNMKNSEVIVVYPDSTVKAIVLLKNFTKTPKNNLTYYWYYQDNINKNLGGYSGKILDGKFLVFDLEKKLIGEGYFKKGLKHGVWKRWYPKGGLISIEKYKNGQKNCVSTLFDKTGKTISIIQYKKGFKNGKSWILENDTLIAKKFRKDVEVIKKSKDIKTKKEITNDQTTKEEKKKEKIKENKNEESINQEKVEKKKFRIFKKKDNQSKQDENQKINKEVDSPDH